MGCDDGEEEGRAVYRALHSYSVDGAGLEGLGGPADGEHHGIKAPTERKKKTPKASGQLTVIQTGADGVR
ncbi:hypothetical protein C0Q70_00661 [Pomacea canaliculata]|uniref:Uncharacterized protein n=1 Tax=Pomacea canaliculata TaxID=400727 RepID=A0A2T7PX91_POMCA|nr:hypothetical protein C0Q70_00661 [Pomacea canaliculata]